MGVRVAIVGGYGPKQSVGAVYRAFQRRGHDVFHVATLPLLDKKPFEADLLFTFKIGHTNIPKGFVNSLKIPYKVFWSFDDPLWIDQNKNPWLAKEHHITLTSCEASIGAYARHGIEAVFMPPAMDLEYYKDWRITRASNHFCSLVCTNLYPTEDFPHQLISRDMLVHKLTFEYGQGFNLYGYGPHVERKPACRGSLEWETTLPRVMESTLVNVNSHVVSNQALYFNERFFQITSTRRAQFVDATMGLPELFGQGGFVFYSSLSELLDKIRYFKSRPKELEAIGAAGFDALQGWTYDNFVSRLELGLEYGTEIQPTFMD